MNSKSSRRDLDAIPELHDLPRFSFTRAPARSRAESAREDVAYGIDSLDALVKEATRRFELVVSKGRRVKRP
ncbi:hypothetical protein [Azospirillum argentinense]|uniref:hypothetical protein n=1 Tax=Azospirillum argentinense TaxID=2970906 RepID=UPI0010C089A8|nr:hypothetical protein [Azospirillum argentinense]